MKLGNCNTIYLTNCSLFSTYGVIRVRMVHILRPEASKTGKRISNCHLRVTLHVVQSCFLLLDLFLLLIPSCSFCQLWATTPMWMTVVLTLLVRFGPPPLYFIYYLFGVGYVMIVTIKAFDFGPNLVFSSPLFNQFFVSTAFFAFCFCNCYYVITLSIVELVFKF